MWNVLNISDPFLHFENDQKGQHSFAWFHLPHCSFHMLCSAVPIEVFFFVQGEFPGKKKIVFFGHADIIICYIVYQIHVKHAMNKRPMGHIAHLKNQFNSMNKFEQSNDYIYHKIGPVVHENIFKFSSLYFCNFAIISLWKRAWPFIWRNLNPLHLRMHFAKFGKNWPSGSRENFKFSLFCDSTLLANGWGSSFV